VIVQRPCDYVTAAGMKQGEILGSHRVTCLYKSYGAFPFFQSGPRYCLHEQQHVCEMDGNSMSRDTATYVEVPSNPGRRLAREEVPSIVILRVFGLARV